MENLKDLEKILQIIDKDLFAEYVDIVRDLRENIYKNINVALAITEGIYTNHDGIHFDLVVEQAGKLLKADKILQIVNKENDINKLSCEDKNIFFFLNSKELFILLCSIRVHDIGLILSRNEHESAVVFVSNMLGVKIKTRTKRLIAEISGAHSGETSLGSRDKIGSFSKFENIASHTIRPKILAAIVRFADELEEGEHRTSPTYLTVGKVQKENIIFHKYSLSLIDLSINHNESSIDLKFEISETDILEKHMKPDKKEVTLLEEIYNRLQKIEQERKYFYRFLCNSLIIESVNSKIAITDAYGNIINTITTTTSEEYPGKESYGLEKLKDFIVTRKANNE